MRIYEVWRSVAHKTSSDLVKWGQIICIIPGKFKKPCNIWWSFTLHRQPFFIHFYYALTKTRVVEFSWIKWNVKLEFPTAKLVERLVEGMNFHHTGFPANWSKYDNSQLNNDASKKAFSKEFFTTLYSAVFRAYRLWFKVEKRQENGRLLFTLHVFDS